MLEYREMWWRDADVVLFEIVRITENKQGLIRSATIIL